MGRIIHLPFLICLTFIILIIHDVYGKIIYEDGYTVKTVIDGNKIKVNPHFAVFRPKLHDVLLLDSSASVFYTLSFPLSQDSLMKRFAGNEKGYSDGDGLSAMFNKPKSFTLDSKGNAYVADRGNFAVRKISPSGVTTTIAGGYSKTPGRADGTGRNVSFSDDYVLTFVPEMCALLVMDHGNKLIRLINLKQEDCGSSKSGLGVTAVWASALIVPCLVGLVIGFAIRPYIMPQDGMNFLNLSKTLTSYRTRLGRQAPMPCFGIRSATVSSALSFFRQLIMLPFSQVTLIYGFWVNSSKSRSSSTVSKDLVTLLDCDNSCSSVNPEFVISQKYANQLKDLVTMDGDSGSSGNILNHDDVAERDGDHPCQIDNLVQATNFTEDVHRSTAIESPFLGVSSVVKRR